MRDLLAIVSVLTTTRDQSQDEVAAVCSLRSGTTPSAKSDPINSITCYRSSGKGHVAKDCQISLLPMWGGWTLGSGLFRKQDREQGSSASFLSHRDVNTALLVANIYVNGTQCCLVNCFQIEMHDWPQSASAP